MRPIAILLALLALAPSLFAQKVEIVNNQTFPIRLPWRLHDGKVVLVDVAASGKQSIDMAMPAKADGPLVTVAPVEDGVAIGAMGRALGTLSWDVLVEKLDKKPTDKEAAETKRDFDRAFAAMPIKFTSKDGEMFKTLSGEATKAGLKLAVEIDVHQSSYIEIRTTVQNISAPQKNVYAAVLTRWQQPAGATNKVGYDNRILDLRSGDATPFRAGEGRHHFIQRGLDWLSTSFPTGGSIAWLNDFAPSWTYYHESKPKTPAHWKGANTAQLAQEAIVVGDKLYSITEIARPNLKMYESRVTANVLPDKDQPLTFTSLLIASKENVDAKRVDELFVGYSSYNEQTKVGEVTRVTFGVPFVKFGTSYFPYSTLGENFEKWHLPGMSKETYWPLAGDIVENYKLFADEIRRDLRIAKAMGFQSIRLHHLELIDTLDRKVQDEFLDFFFGEVKHVGLTALLDVKLPPARIAELVKKYRPQVDGVEIDNEVLLMSGVVEPDIPYWKDVYKAVKEVAPDMPVWLTGHTNTGAFERLRKLGVPFDMVGCHAYMDSLDAIPSGRNYALAVADYGSEIGKPPVITEWNWRFLTRMTPENRAKVYAPIFENVFSTRSVPVFYQFQFQESLAMTTRSLRGIRHYEPLNLSRRPRPEAFEFMKLIQKYGDPNAPQIALRTDYDWRATVIHKGMLRDGSYRVHMGVHMTNNSERPRKLKLSAEGPSGIKVEIRGQTEYEIPAGQRHTAELVATIPQDAPIGFYHVFARIDGGEDRVTYSWHEIQKTGPLKIDKGESKYHPEVKYLDDALDYNFNRDIAIVYPERGLPSESRWDVESAWLIYQTLEAATGRPVKIFQMNDLPADLKKSGNLIFVDMPNFKGPTTRGSVSTTQLAPSAPKAATKPTGNSWVKRIKPTGDHGDWLIVAGDDEQTLNIAAIDLVLRYWPHAKDSAMRRIPLTDKPIQKGMDPSLLP